MTSNQFVPLASLGAYSNAIVVCLLAVAVAVARSMLKIHLE